MPTHTGPSPLTSSPAALPPSTATACRTWSRSTASARGCSTASLSAGSAPAVSSRVTARRRAPTTRSSSGRSMTSTSGAYDPKVRLEVLDECGIDAQIIFPSTIGLGGQGLGAGDDPVITRLAVEIYNDAMAEIQADSNNRLLPLPLMPAWNIDGLRPGGAAGGGARCSWREHDVGSRRTSGAPDLANRAWDPFWEVCSDLAAAGALPHRGERHGDDVLRQVPVGVAPDEHPARHRRHAAVHRQRAGGHEPDPVGHLRPPPRS